MTVSGILAISDFGGRGGRESRGKRPVRTKEDGGGGRSMVYLLWSGSRWLYRESEDTHL